ALARQHRELQREHLVIALVIGEAGDHGRIGRQRVHAQTGAARLRQRIKEIVGEMVGVAAATAIAAEEHLTAGLPAVAQVVGKAFDRAPVEALQRRAEAVGIVAEKLAWCLESERVHFTTSFSIHFRLYQRSSFLSWPCEYMPMISLIASSTVFFGRKPVASSRSELTR